MTTQHTPYDKELSEVVYGSNGPTLAQQAQLRDLHALREGYQECYATVVVPLLEAARATLPALVQAFLYLDSVGTSNLVAEAAKQLRAAIAQACPQKHGEGVAKPKVTA